MATPADTDFIISQGDSLPVMRIPVPANSAGQLIDLTGCTVTFLGRVAGTRTFPPPIIRPIQRYAQEGDVIAVYVKLTTDDTKAVTGTETFTAMDGELEVKHPTDGTLTIPNDPDAPYLRWWIRDDIGEGA